MLNRSQLAHGVPLPADHPRRWTRYVAVGDSLSEGLGDPLTGGATRGWANLLAAHLRTVQPALEARNLAVRGHLTRHAVDRQLDAALAFEPDLVSIFIGGNDVLLRGTFDADRFQRELELLVEPFASRDATVVLSTLPDLTACSPLLPPLRGVVRRRVIRANEVIRVLSRRHGTVLLDAEADPRTRRHAMWSIDRIHPSAEGHRLIAASVAELLGVPLAIDAHELARASLLDTARRHGREAAWLARHAVRRDRSAGELSRA
jgi:lysophospholipase L1-like esterase